MTKISMAPQTSKSLLHSPTSGHELLKSLSFITRKNNKVGDEGNRFLVMIYVTCSAGPLKIVVKEDDKVGDVICAALKLYTREGRLPALGCKASQFELHCAHNGSGALCEDKEIGGCQSRSFVLCKKNKENNHVDSYSEGRVERLKPKPAASHLTGCLSFLLV